MKKPAGGAPIGQAKPTSGMKKGTTNGGKPSGKSLSSMPKTTKGRPTCMKGGLWPRWQWYLQRWDRWGDPPIPDGIGTAN